MGSKKSDIRKMLEELDLIGELDGEVTIKDIAEKYCASKTITGIVLTEQLQRKQRYKRAEGSDGFEERLLNSKSLGQWSLSIEAAALEDYRKNLLDLKDNE